MRVWVDITDSSHVLFFAPVVRRLEDHGHIVTLTARRFASAELTMRRLGLGAVLDRAAPRRRTRRPRRRARQPHGAAPRLGLERPLRRRRRQPRQRLRPHRVGARRAAAHAARRRAPRPEQRRQRAARRPGRRPGRRPRRRPGARSAPRATGSCASRASRRSTTCTTSSPTPASSRSRRRRPDRRGRDPAPARRAGRRLRAGLATRALAAGARRPTGAGDAAARELEAFVRELARRRNLTLVLVSRDDEQRERFPGLGLANLVMPEPPVDGVSLIAAADFVLGGGGVMSREAIALRHPRLHALARHPVGDRRGPARRRPAQRAQKPADLALRKKDARTAAVERRDPPALRRRDRAARHAGPHPRTVRATAVRGRAGTKSRVRDASRGSVEAEVRPAHPPAFRRRMRRRAAPTA